MLNRCEIGVGKSFPCRCYFLVPLRLGNLFCTRTFLFPFKDLHQFVKDRLPKLVSCYKFTSVAYVKLQVAKKNNAQEKRQQEQRSGKKNKRINNFVIAKGESS